jgi:signal transduction histidine kinase/DNA-binding NarL/FixJ family response regulator
MSWNKMMPWRFNRYLVAIVLIAVFADLRIWPLAALESRLVWLTFYPAVMVIAIYGGLSAGLLATSLACLTAVFLWPLLVAQPFIKDAADWLGLMVFVVTGTMISGVAEAMLRAKARAKKAQEQAEAANKAKNIFLANMNHELRTPLNAILGFSTILHQDTNIPENQRKSLDIINLSAERLLALINDVLDLAKIDAGRLSIESSAFDLIETLREVTDLLYVRAEEKHLQLELVLAPECPRFVHADAGKLRQTIINLVGNAIKFTEQGSVTLRVTAQPGDSPQRPVLIVEVEDTGIGITAEDQKSIFEPFIQIVTQKLLQKGTGLGLSITRKFVELMGGRISVQSLSGKGSIFRVEVPVNSAQASEVYASEMPRGYIVGLAPGQPEFRVLIVEDQMENWLLLQHLLEPIGFQVRVAENGIEGIELFKVWRPHFIWMDVRMPIMDGLEAARRIRKLEGGQLVKIVAITTSVIKEERDTAMAAGMDDLICKPYRPAEIYDCLRRYLGTSFVYLEEAPPASSLKPSTVLHPKALASLPEALHGELGNALIHLDAARICDVIGRITELNPVLGRILAHHAGQLSYTAILQALKASTRNSTVQMIKS